MGENLLNPIIARFHEDRGKSPAVNTGVRVQPRTISENKKGLKALEIRLLYHSVLYLLLLIC